jgi:anti-sigma regulatory factor (Ser/Thr protein kinase)
MSVRVSETSQVAEARRTAVAVAQANGFDADAAGRVALVATELATNLIKHGGGGHLIASSYDDGNGQSGVQIIAIDKGPGILDITVSLRDGVSTSGTRGNGLGAVMRQSHAFDIFSRPGAGTVVIARLEAGRPSKPAPWPATGFPPWGAINVPYPGEEVSGDDWYARVDDAGLTLMVVDGLGHGPQAAEAAGQAGRLFDKHWRSSPVDTLHALHAGLRATRGAAIAIARVDVAQRRVIYAGVGNIVGAIIGSDGQSRRMISHNGTVGHIAPRIQAFDYPLTDPATATIVMHSDGIATNWSPAAYPGLFAAHPAMIAAVLYRDFTRNRDDATILAARSNAA